MGRSSICGIGTDFESKYWLSLDPCGLLCITFSISIHLFAVVAAGLTLISHHVLSQVLYGALYVPFAFMALTSLYMAATTDPGAVPMGARPIPANLAAESDSIVTERDTVRGGLRRRRGIRRCRKCNDNYKPPRAHHDSVTGRCVVKMDHYCPWVCNAVGIMNHKFFILFILYTFLTAIVSLALIFIRVIRCGFYVEPTNTPSHNGTLRYTYDDLESEFEHRLLSHPYDRERLYPGCDNITSPIVAVLAIITVLFFFFTCCMLLEQGEAVDTNMSKIARMKTRAGIANPGEYAPVATEFNEVFGGEHPTVSWHWFLPLPVRFPAWARENVMGYEWDVTFDPAPYQEPADTDGDTVCSQKSTTSSLGRGEKELDTPLVEGDNFQSGDDIEKGGNSGDHGGNVASLEQEGHEEREIQPAKSENLVKKRSTGSFT